MLETDELVQKPSIFKRFLDCLYSSRETLGDIGNDLITKAQTDLYNLKDDVLGAWDITDAERTTMSRYSTAVLGRIFKILSILAFTLVFSPIKLVGGSICLFVALRWGTLAGRLFNTGWEIFKQGCELLGTLAKNFCTNVFELLRSIVNRFCDICSRIMASIMRNIIWTCEKLKAVWDFVYEKIEVVVVCIKDLVKSLFSNVFHFLYHILEAGVSVISGGLNAAVTLATTAVMMLGALIFETGVSKLISGAFKLIFTLTEGMASTTGVILDGTSDASNSLFIAFSALIGNRKVVAKPEADERRPLLGDSTEVDAELGLVEQAAVAVEQTPGILYVGPGSIKNTGCRKSLHGVARDFNGALVSAGTFVEEGYFANKADLYPSYDGQKHIRASHRMAAALALGS